MLAPHTFRLLVIISCFLGEMTYAEQFLQVLSVGTDIPSSSSE